ncbi:MAG: hypothetical protein ABIH04_02850 [Planctomycetota bacterium]
MEKKIADMVIIPAFFAFILLVSAPNPASADSTNWTGLTGSWHDPLNWDNGVPTLDDYPYIDNGGTAQISADAESDCLYTGYLASGVIEQSAGIYSNNGVRLGSESGSSGTYNLSAGELSVGSYVYIGCKGTGEFNQTGGIHTISSNLRLSYHSGSGGTYNLGGTGELSAGSEYIGYYGTGEFNQTGGINTVSAYLYLGRYFGSSGIYNLSAGNFSAHLESIGADGMGEFNQDGGTHTVDYYLRLGDSSISSGTYNLSAGELSVGPYEYIGYTGTGEFNQTGGTHTVSDYLYFGYESGSSGTYNLSAGELSVGSEYIGYDGTGEFNQTGGTHTVEYLYVKDDSSYTLNSGTLSISDSAEVYGSFGFTDGDWTLNVNGGLANFADAVIDGAGSASFTSAADSLTIFPTGFDAAAQFDSYNALGLVHTAGSTLVISSGEGFAGRGWIDDHVQNSGNIVASGGSLDFRGGLTISDGGTLDSSSYNFTVDNGATVTIAASGGELSAPSEYIGLYGTGEFNQNGGIHTVSDDLRLGYYSGSNGTYNLSAGELSVGNCEYIGHYGTGEFNQDGGTHTVSNYLYLGYKSGSSGTYNQTGGTHTVSNSLRLGDESGSNGTYNLSAGILSVSSSGIIGSYGTGEFNQTGGSHTVNYITLGYWSGSSGTYNLSAGELSVGSSEYIGQYDGMGEFNQTGGTHTVGYLYVKDNSSYTLSGGTLSIGDNAEVYGSFHFTDDAWTLNVNGGLANFEDAVIDGAGSASFTSAVNSLTIFPTGFDTAQFVSYNPLGLVHIAGSTLVISAGEGFAGRGWIGDHVQNRGNIVASGGALDFRGGLTISDGGTLDSSNYNFRVDNGATVTIAASGGEIVAPSEYIGYYGTGEFNQDGGTNTASDLFIGKESGSSGTYNLSAGVLSSLRERIGYEGGTGAFSQDGGIHTVGYSLYIGHSWGNGTYNLSAGELSVGGDVGIGGGSSGTGEFNQSGGSHTVNITLFLGCDSGASGKYNLSAGELSVGADEYIGGYDSRGTGEFNQTGGIHTVGGFLYFGYGDSLSASGTYNLGGTGELFVGSSEYIGRGRSTNEFNQTGGTNHVVDNLAIGIYSGTGIYNINGGFLETGDLVIGSNGTFNVTNNAASITTGGSMTLENGAEFSAVPGTTIHMTGSIFDNQSISSSEVSGLWKTTFIFEGGIEDIDTFEIAGMDYGTDGIGFSDNFALGGLMLGGVDVGYVQLVENNDNGNRSGPAGYDEALYLRSLTINSGSTLDLNGYHLYTLCYTDNGGTVLNGEINVIPEPSTIFLMIGSASVLAVIAGLAREKCRSIEV